MIKTIILLTFIAIVLALGSAMFHLVSNKRDDPEDRQAHSDKLFKSLAWRIGLSVSLFIFLMISYMAGWIKPQGTLTQMIERQTSTMHKK